MRTLQRKRTPKQASQANRLAMALVADVHATDFRLQSLHPGQQPLPSVELRNNKLILKVCYRGVRYTKRYDMGDHTIYDKKFVSDIIRSFASSIKRRR